MCRWKNDTRFFKYRADREFFGTHYIVIFWHRFALPPVKVNYKIRRVNMTQVEERITYVKKAIATLEAWDAQTHQDKLNKVINLAEYRAELEMLEQIKRSNASLFR